MCIKQERLLDEVDEVASKCREGEDVLTGELMAELKYTEQARSFS